MHPLLDLSAHPVIGHRGNAAHAPENTIESFQQAVAIGVDALELDVHLTGDGHVVVIHDSTLDRTTDQSGRVERLTLAEIRRADAGARYSVDRGVSHPYRDTGIQVPTLDEVLDMFGEMPLLIEIKTPAAALATRQAVERHGAGHRCVVAAFQEASMEPFRGSGIAQGASRRDTARLIWRAALGIRVKRVDFDVMCMPPVHRGLPLPVRGFAKLLEPIGVPVHVWTIDEPDDARRLRQRGVRGIISNDPAAIMAEVG